MPRAHVHPVPDLDRALPEYPSDAAFYTRGSDRPFETPLLLAPAGPPGSPHRQQFPVARSRLARHFPDTAGAGWAVDVPDAEDDYNARGRRSPGVDQPHDVVDDADHVRVLHAAVPQRVGPLLDSFQRCRYSNPGLRDGLGSTEIAWIFAQAVLGARHGAGACAPDRGGGYRCR